MIELESIISDLELNSEMGLALNLPYKINDFSFPAPSVAALICLEAIKSPYAVGADEIKVTDFLTALFVIAQPEQAAELIFAELREKEIQERTGKGKPEDLREDFRIAVFSFANSLGCFDYAKESSNLVQYLKLSITGFEMIHTQKKTGDKADLTRNFWQWFWLCAGNNYKRISKNLFIKHR